MRITRASPSRAARRGDGSGSNSAKMSSSTTVTSCDPDRFAEMLAAHRPRLYLTNSALHNPTGATLSPADLGPVGAQQRLEVEVARVVDQHRIARAQQEAADPGPLRRDAGGPPPAPLPDQLGAPQPDRGDAVAGGRPSARWARSNAWKLK
jgi:hypothetical protein